MNNAGNLIKTAGAIGRKTEMATTMPPTPRNKNTGLNENRGLPFCLKRIIVTGLMD